jgi:hypothetical protein
MGDREFNIKSSTIEKGLDLVKDFLDKLISPSVGEFGQLIADNVKFLRGKNQVRILQKAKAYVEKNNIDVKQIPIKILVPFLEHASLEEDETLQDKWAILLANMASSKANLQNQIFPYLLSQISIEEFNGLGKLKEDEDDFASRQANLHLALKDKIVLYPEQKRIQQEFEDVKRRGFLLAVEEYEAENLFRLGLVRQLPPPIYIPEFSTGGTDDPMAQQWHALEAEYDPDDFGYRITKLGEMFWQMCQEKKPEKTE